MNVELINVFILAGKSVLQQACGIEVATGKPYLKNKVDGQNGVALIIGLTGNVKGQVVLNMSTEIAIHLASKLMFGFEVNEFDDMAKSAVSELANMILGNAATLLSNKGINIDITPPSLIMGENVQISSAGGAQVVCIPLFIEENKAIEMDIFMKE